MKIVLNWHIPNVKNAKQKELPTFEKLATLVPDR
jgi:hypothetical protein